MSQKCLDFGLHVGSLLLQDSLPKPLLFDPKIEQCFHLNFKTMLVPFRDKCSSNVTPKFMPDSETAILWK